MKTTDLPLNSYRLSVIGYRLRERLHASSFPLNRQPKGFFEKKSEPTTDNHFKNMFPRNP